jgi:hypothetical protein
MHNSKFLLLKALAISDPHNKYVNFFCTLTRIENIMYRNTLKPGFRSRRIRKFLGLPDPELDPLVGDTDPAPDPSIIK